MTPIERIVLWVARRWREMKERAEYNRTHCICGEPLIGYLDEHCSEQCMLADLEFKA